MSVGNLNADSAVANCSLFHCMRIDSEKVC